MHFYIYMIFVCCGTQFESAWAAGNPQPIEALVGEPASANYLATLEDALTKAETTGKHTTLVARTRRWLDNLSIHTDLDDWRFEMARRTTALRR